MVKGLIAEEQRVSTRTFLAFRCCVTPSRTALKDLKRRLCLRQGRTVTALIVGEVHASRHRRRLILLAYSNEYPDKRCDCQWSIKIAQPIKRGEFLNRIAQEGQRF